jgi:hypothetical protein
MMGVQSTREYTSAFFCGLKGLQELHSIPQTLGDYGALTIPDRLFTVGYGSRSTSSSSHLQTDPYGISILLHIS